MRIIQTNDRVRLAVGDLNCQADKTIVMVHGWPLSHKIFEYQTETLTRCGYRVVAPDLRGFGDSEATAGGYCYDRLADDLDAVIRALGLRRFVLAGFSMGGAIVLRYMRRHQGRGVRKLVLMGAAAPSFIQRPGFPCGVTRQSVDVLIEQARTDRPLLCATFGDKLFARPHSAAFHHWMTDISLRASGIGTVQTACSLRDEDGRDDLPRVLVPTGIFHGKKDRVVPFELALVQHQGIRGSVLYPFEDSGHGVFYDELCAFNRALLHFLSQ